MPALYRDEIELLSAGDEPWLQELHTRFAEIDLSRTARRSVDDPSRHLIGANRPRLFGTWGFLKYQPVLARARPGRGGAELLLATDAIISKIPERKTAPGAGGMAEEM